MKNHHGLKLSSFVFAFVCMSLLISCSKEDLSSPELIAAASKPPAGKGKNKNTDTTTEPTDPGTTDPGGSTEPTDPVTTNPLFTLNVNWDNRSDATYGYTQAVQDFGSSVYWNSYVSQTKNTMLQATLAKNVVGPSGGVMSRFDVPDASEYQLEYDMMFGSDFDWSAGGKVGFGFQIGEGYTGGGNATDGNGGSARIMWEKNSSGRVYLKPYLYYKDQPGTWGDNLGKTYPASGSIQKGTWYRVNLYVKSNNGSNTDGHIRMVINGTTVIDQAIRWTTNDLQRLVRHVCFENFRGGSESYWASSTDGNIFFDNVKWSVLKY